MNIKEMHVSVQTEMNKVNSFLFDTFQPQEIDSAINKMILFFVNQRYSSSSNLKRKGFEMSQKRIDDLRTLVVSNYTEFTPLPETYDPDYTSKVQFFFPGDYYHNVATRFRVSYDTCEGSPSVLTTTKTYTLYKLDLSAITNWSTLRIRRATDTPLNLGSDATNYNNVDDLSFIARIIRQILKRMYVDFSKYEFYYEHFRDVYNKNTLIIVSKDNSVFQVSTDSGSSYSNISSSSYTYTHYSASPNLTTSGKLVEQDDIFAMQADPFNKTSADFPLYHVSDIDFNIYINRNSFVITNAILSYLRIPNTVSWYLNENCDLPEGTHPEIVSMATNYLLEVVQAGERFQTHQSTVIQSE
jgi:hypothetical protein